MGRRRHAFSDVATVGTDVEPGQCHEVLPDKAKEEMLQSARIMVLAGTGGNGGGGITVAGRLANHGARVELCLAVPDMLSEVAACSAKCSSRALARKSGFGLWIPAHQAVAQIMMQSRTWLVSSGGNRGEFSKRLQSR